VSVLSVFVTNVSLV